MSHNINDTTGLSRLFHLNSEPWLNEKPGGNAPFTQKTKSYPDAARIVLPSTDEGAIDKLAASRRSQRAFQDAPMALGDLAALLRSGYAALGPDPLGKGPQHLRRPVPSAGGLYPLEVYALVRNVAGLAKGIYHYEAVGDALELVFEGPWEDQAKEGFLTWSFVEHAPVIVCISAVFERTQSKYGPRGYRYILLEAGHVVQNMCLAATDLDLSSLCMGGYRDGVLNRLTSLDGLNEAIVYTVALGADREV